MALSSHMSRTPIGFITNDHSFKSDKSIRKSMLCCSIEKSSIHSGTRIETVIVFYFSHQQLKDISESLFCFSSWQNECNKDHITRKVGIFLLETSFIFISFQVLRSNIR